MQASAGTGRADRESSPDAVMSGMQMSTVMVGALVMLVSSGIATAQDWQARSVQHCMLRAHLTAPISGLVPALMRDPSLCHCPLGFLRSMLMRHDLTKR